MGISIHALLAESDQDAWIGDGEVVQISIHALLAESDVSLEMVTSPALRISIHALLAESDSIPIDSLSEAVNISIHALLAESDPIRYAIYSSSFEFQSTLSLRRATCPLIPELRAENISIHALLAESDSPRRYISGAYPISIHALLAESDRGCSFQGRVPPSFQSTLSLRRATSHRTHSFLSVDYFNPRSPCGERPSCPLYFLDHATRFQSTLSLRRATFSAGTFHHIQRISIHALLAESDRKSQSSISVLNLFQSTLSLRRATRAGPPWPPPPRYFNPRSPCGERLPQGQC